MPKSSYARRLHYTLLLFFKKVYNNLSKTVEKMGTIFLKSENGKTNECHKFKLNLGHKTDLKDLNKNIALVNLRIYYAWKNIKHQICLQ